LLARDETILHLREVRLEETHLMLFVRRRHIGAGVLHAEMVVHFTLIDSRRGLRDQLSPKHVVTVPDGRVVDGNLEASL